MIFTNNCQRGMMPIALPPCPGNGGVGGVGPAGPKGDPGPKGDKGDPGTGGSFTAEDLAKLLAENPSALSLLWAELEKLDKDLTLEEIAAYISSNPATITAITNAIAGSTTNITNIVKAIASNPQAIADLWKELEKLDKDLTPAEMAAAIAADPAALAALWKELEKLDDDLTPEEMAAAIAASPVAMTSIVNAITNKPQNIQNITNAIINNPAALAALIAALPPEIHATKLGFNPSTGVFSVTLSDGTVLTQALPVSAVDKFLKSVVYTKPNMVFTMTDGTVFNVPLSDLIPVVTKDAITGDGTAANPIGLKIDPASVGLTAGPNGLKFTVDPSSKGEKGDAGPAGPKGDQGIQGLQGLKGDQGVQGPKGDTGLQGPKGDQGIAGAAGAKGDTGLQGIQGLKGDPGADGPKGDQGAQGVQGIQGETGAKGDQGDIGPAGPSTPQTIDSIITTVTGSGPSRTITTTVNGKTSTPEPIPDSDNQTLSIAGDKITISGGNEITLPAKVPPVVKVSVSPVTGTGASSARDLLVTVDGVTSAYPLKAMTSGLSQTLIGFCFPAN